MKPQDLHAYRRAKDEFLKRDHRSPIEDQAGFDHLEYFEPDDAYRFTEEPVPADGSSVTVQTSDGREREYRRSAEVSIHTPDGPVDLTLYTTSGSSGFFVPFRDSTSGRESYGAGRYLDVEPNSDGTVTIDFNLAYNPYCAYSDAYSCPLPPSENWLSVPIRAGEKAF